MELTGRWLMNVTFVTEAMQAVQVFVETHCTLREGETYVPRGRLLRYTARPFLLLHFGENNDAKHIVGFLCCMTITQTPAATPELLTCSIQPSHAIVIAFNPCVT